MPVDFNGPNAKVAFSQFLEPLVDEHMSGRADKIVNAAKAAAPVGKKTPKPGTLRDSIHKEKIINGYKVIADASNGKSRYGYWVEVGHAKRGRSRDGKLNIPPNPFLWPAVEAARDG